jgi:hypothetical protein
VTTDGGTLLFPSGNLSHTSILYYYHILFHKSNNSIPQI